MVGSEEEKPDFKVEQEEGRIADLSVPSPHFLINCRCLNATFQLLFGVIRTQFSLPHCSSSNDLSAPLRKVPTDDLSVPCFSHLSFVFVSVFRREPCRDADRHLLAPQPLPRAHRRRPGRPRSRPVLYLDGRIRAAELHRDDDVIEY